MGGSKEANRLGGEKIEAPTTKWLFEDDLMVEIKVIENSQAPLHVGAGFLLA